MVIAIFGESCAGKSTIANELQKKHGAKVYTGKDYTRLSKNEAEAKKIFVELLSANENSNDIIVYVISEKEHLALLPQKTVRILVTAELEAIKERFTKRMNGKLPAPVAAMLEKKHGSFDSEAHDIHISNTNGDIEKICAEILTRQNNRN